MVSKLMSTIHMPYNIANGFQADVYHTRAGTAVATKGTSHNEPDPPVRGASTPNVDDYAQDTWNKLYKESTDGTKVRGYEKIFFQQKMFWYTFPYKNIPDVRSTSKKAGLASAVQDERAIHLGGSRIYFHCPHLLQVPPTCIVFF